MNNEKVRTTQKVRTRDEFSKIYAFQNLPNLPNFPNLPNGRFGRFGRFGRYMYRYIWF